MKQRNLACGTLAACLIGMATPAVAGSLTSSIEDRAGAVRARVEGMKDYHACLARDLADIAEVEKSQHDLSAARIFIDMAEQAASGTGGK